MACIPGVSHRPSRRRCHLPQYWLFRAASDGCLPCVQRLLHEDGVDIHGTSLTQAYTALDFAMWARQQGVTGADAVVTFLSREIATDVEGEWEIVQLEAPARPIDQCLPGVSHLPPRRRREQRKYRLFWAASAGCLRCVRHYIADEGVDPGSKSNTQGWTALDFAAWARQRGVVGADDVEAFLRDGGV